MKYNETYSQMDELAVNPYYEIHLDLTYMTEREFKHAVGLLDSIRSKFNVVLKL